jgi:hypothetical protein
MTHAEIVSLLGAYVDGELSSWQRQAVVAHLQQCPACMRQVDELRRVSNHLQVWPAMQRGAEQERVFCEQILGRLPARGVPIRAEAKTRQAGRFLFPAGVILTSAFLQSAALITAILSIVVASGILGGTFLQIDEGLSGLMRASGDTVTRFTWIGQLVEMGLERAGVSGAQIGQWGATALSTLLPAAVFLVFTILVFLGLSGWAGWQMARKRV